MDHAPQTCVLKMNLKCEGCRKKVTKKLLKFQGVHSFHIDADKGKVTISSTIHPQELLGQFAKLGKKVELLPLDDEYDAWPNSNSQNNNAAQNKKVAPPPRYHPSNRDQFDPYHLAQLQQMGNNQRLKQVELTHSSNIKMTFNDHTGDLMHEGHANIGNGYDSDGSESRCSSSSCGDGGGGKGSASSSCYHECGSISEGQCPERWPPNYVPSRGSPPPPLTPNYYPAYGGPLPNPYPPPQTRGPFNYKPGTCRLM